MESRNKEENVILDEIPFSSPRSLNDEMVENRTLKEKIRLFEDCKNTESKKVEVPSKSKVETMKKKFLREEEDGNGFASSEIEEGIADSVALMDENSNHRVAENGHCEAMILGKNRLAHQQPEIKEHYQQPEIKEHYQQPEIKEHYQQPEIKENVISPKLSSIEFPIKNYNEISPTCIKKDFPLSSEIIKNIPSFLKSSNSFYAKSSSYAKSSNSFYAIPECIKSPNLYLEKSILFSKKDKKFNEVVFRSPGNILMERPILSLENTIITEYGILQYFKISTMDYKTIWYILKEKMDSISKIVNSDLIYSKFILSNVVETVHKRSNFLIFNGEIFLVKFIGILLCIFKHNVCMKTIRMEDMERIGKNKISIGGEILELSCEIEREEWIRDIEEYIKSK